MYGTQGRPGSRSLIFIPKQAGRRFAPGDMSRLESCSTRCRSGLTGKPGIKRIKI